MGKTEGVPCATTPLGRGVQATVVSSARVARTGAETAASGFRRFSQFLVRRWGLGRTERVAVYGTMIGAPLALIAAPAVGIALAVGLTSPALFSGFRRRSKAQKEARLQIHQDLDPVADAADKEVEKLDRVSELEAIVSHQMEMIAALVEHVKESNDRQDTIADAVEEFMKDQTSDGAAPEKKEKKSRKQKRPSVYGNANVKAKTFEKETGRIENIVTLDKVNSAGILDGTRNVIFKNGLSKIRPGSESVVYTKQPLAQIPGTVKIGDVVTGAPEDVWEAVGEQSGMDKKEFLGEARKVRQVKTGSISALVVREVKRFEDPIDYRSSGLTNHDVLGSTAFKPEDKDRHRKLLSMINSRETVQKIESTSTPGKPVLPSEKRRAKNTPPVAIQKQNPPPAKPRKVIEPDPKPAPSPESGRTFGLDELESMFAT